MSRNLQVLLTAGCGSNGNDNNSVATLDTYHHLTPAEKAHSAVEIGSRYVSTPYYAPDGRRIGALAAVKFYPLATVERDILLDTAVPIGTVVLPANAVSAIATKACAPYPGNKNDTDLADDGVTYTYAFYNPDGGLVSTASTGPLDCSNSGAR